MNATRLFPRPVVLVARSPMFAAPADSPRERISLNANWRFIKGDAPDGGTNLNYTAITRLDPADGQSVHDECARAVAGRRIRAATFPSRNPVLTTASGGS